MTTQFSRTVRFALLSSFAAYVLTTSGAALAAHPVRTVQVSPSAPNATPSGGARSADVSGRIQRLHDMLKITRDQEIQWSGVAKVMMDNAMAVDDAIQARTRKAGNMTAVDDLLSYQAIIAAHAEGLKKLVAVFAPLYSAMPVPQQKLADSVFGHRTTAKLRAHG